MRITLSGGGGGCGGPLWLASQSRGACGCDISPSTQPFALFEAQLGEHCLGLLMISHFLFLVSL